MTDEDLLTTNNLSNDLSNDFLKIKSDNNNKYDVNLPNEFIDNPKEDVTGFVSENSIGFDQFNELANTEQRKKTIRTIVNIDSKNRKKRYTFRKILINQKNEFDKLIYFYNNSKIFYVITEDTYLENYKLNKEVIITDFNLSSTSIDTNRFIFDEITGEPILKVRSLIYNSVKNSESNDYLNPRSSDIYNKRNYYDNSIMLNRYLSVDLS